MRSPKLNSGRMKSGETRNAYRSHLSPHRCASPRPDRSRAYIARHATRQSLSLKRCGQPPQLFPIEAPINLHPESLGHETSAQGLQRLMRRSPGAEAIRAGIEVLLVKPSVYSAPIRWMASTVIINCCVRSSRA